ncbi:MAG: biotin--[acetyl-CoA-carboxylase] ligase [Chloroflexota bacterium]|jgi:BirA family biotin operon repressor/biotin-[acetyl-CoA-carboxylase] ligase
MSESRIRAALNHLPIPALRYLDKTGSTNDDALQWAARGAPHLALVAADRQTAGRGRLGRSWQTLPGAALAFSLVLRPAAPARDWLALYSPLGALAVSLALENGWHLAPQIKWPNDVLLGGRKVCGVLAEAAWQGDRLQAVVLGIGINVAPSAVPPESLLIFPATCVEAYSGSPLDRWQLLARVLEQLLARLGDVGSPAFLRDWQDRLAYLGQPIRLEDSTGKVVTGKLAGVTSQGQLRVQLADASEACFSAGDVRLRPTDEMPHPSGGG